MSETVHFKGKLVPVSRPEGTTVEEQIKGMLTKPIDETYYDNYREYFRETYYHDYTIIDDTIYRIEENNDIYHNDIFRSSENEDGSIDYEIKYYNSGCSYHTALEFALENK